MREFKVGDRIRLLDTKNLHLSSIDDYLATVDNIVTVSEIEPDGNAMFDLPNGDYWYIPKVSITGEPLAGKAWDFVDEEVNAIKKGLPRTSETQDYPFYITQDQAIQFINSPESSDLIDKFVEFCKAVKDYGND